ncbi:MAG: BatD family protein, partial [Bacteroidales bacterium]
MRVVKSILFTLLFSLNLLPLMGQVNVTVEVPKVVEVGENFRLQYTISAKPHSFSPPKIDNFTILAGPSTSTMSSVQIINGKRTETVENSYTFILIAESEGKFTIPPANFKVDGKGYSSKAVTIEVIKGSQKRGTKEGTTLEG